MSVFPFTNGVRLVLMRSRDHAAERGHEYVGTEHLLLALLDEQDSECSRVLDRLHCDRTSVRALIDATIKPGRHKAEPGAQLPYTSRAKKVLELAALASRNEPADFVGTEHLLLGLLHEQLGIGAQVLVQSGITVDAVRDAIRELR